MRTVENRNIKNQAEEILKFLLKEDWSRSSEYIKDIDNKEKANEEVVSEVT